MNTARRRRLCPPVRTLVTASLGAGLLLATLSTSAVEMPRRKSGLWEIQTTVKGMEQPGRLPIQHCIDEKTDDLMRQSAREDTHCVNKEIQRSGDRLTMTSVCRFGETTATSQAVFTGRFDTHYRGEIRTNYTPPMMGMKEATTLIEARWIGPCKAGMKPGDVIAPGLPAGMPNININELLKQR